MKALEIAWLQDFTNILLIDSDPDLIERKFSCLLKYYQLVNYTLGFSQPIWRARRCDSAIGFKNSNELGAPPSNLIKQPGRLNEIGKTVFYASFHKHAALEEVNAREGDFVHIAGYTIKEGIRGGIVGEFFNVHRSGNSVIHGDVGDKLNNILSKLPHRVGLSVVFLDAFFSSILRDNNAHLNSYLHSRILGRLLMSKLDGLDALFYPSVVTENAMNVALSVNSAFEKLKMAGNSVLQIQKRYDYGIFEFAIIRNANGEKPDGTIVWI